MYKPITAVWEITMGCNMRCKHCGSSCTNPLDDELSTSEALDLCDQLKDIGLQFITLSGGEPTTRKDWFVIAEKLVKNGIKTSIITNGWTIDSMFINIAKQIGLDSIAISIDGLDKTHDYIRKPQSFERSVRNIKLLVDGGLKVNTITAINTHNIDELDALFSLFNSLGVFSWQLQIAQPMGTFKRQKELLLPPKRITEIIDFAHSKIKQSPLIVLSDCIGYYSKKSIEVNENFLQDNWSWTGCGAGKHVIGILQNGDIIGCTSIRNKDLIAGNIRQSNLAEIWNNDKKFSWNRNRIMNESYGFCYECVYSEKCLGGCSNTRLCMNGTLDSENLYCTYNQECKRFKDYILSIEDDTQIEELANRYGGNKNLSDIIALKQKSGRI